MGPPEETIEREKEHQIRPRSFLRCLFKRLILFFIHFHLILPFFFHFLGRLFMIITPEFLSSLSSGGLFLSFSVGEVSFLPNDEKGA